MKRFTHVRYPNPGMAEDDAGEYVLYDDANAEAADLSIDLHAREERVLELERLLAIAESRVRALEALVEKTQGDIAAYLTTRGM